MADGKHQLLLELGRGGMGTVYLAVSRGPAGFSKLKVVKRLRADLASDEGFLKMFLDEARLTARLNHPNVVQTNEVGFDGAHYFIEMEYLEGQSFDGLLRRSAKAAGLPRELSLYVLAQALAGLHYAHELKDLGGQPLRIVHRDVSPHNVFVTYDGAVKVLDFGIAKAADSSSDTTTGVVKGKATYMAPEQAARRSVDRRADVFAVGVMLWEALTRKRLWAGLSDFEIFLALQKEPPPAPRTVDATIPEPLDAICRKALAFEPDERFATAKEMQLALEDVLATGGGRAGPGPLADRVCELFAERREAIAREIDARMKQIEAGGGEISARTSVDVPVLGMAKGVLETSTGPTRSRAGVVSGEATRAAVPSARKLPAAEGEGEEGDEKEGAGADSTRDGGGRGTKSAVTSDLPKRRGSRSRTGIAVGVGLLALAGGAAAWGFRRHSPAATVDDARGGAAVAPHAAPGACATNKECLEAHGGAPFVCRKSDHQCVSVDSDDCQTSAPAADLQNDDALWLGAMFRFRTGSADMLWEVHAIDLARADFMGITKGIPRPSDTKGPRPIVTVFCDDGNEPARAARHLADDLEVPAVIGFSSPTEVLDIFPKVFLPKKTLVLDSRETTPLLSSLPMPKDAARSFFRLNANQYLYLDLTAQVAAQVVEPAILASSKHVEKGALRLAIVRDGTPYQVVSTDRLMDRIVWNGKSSVDNGSLIQSFVVTQKDPPPNGELPLEALAKALIAFRPNAILVEYAYPELYPVLHALEAQWPASVDYKPWYLVVSDLDDEALHAFVGKDAGLRHRILGSQFRSQTLANARFVRHYNETYPEKLTPALASNTSYDAAYLVAYAAAAAGDGPLTGARLAAAMPRLQPPGAKIQTGPSTILEIVAALQRGDNVDLTGSSGSLDFDMTTGDAKVDLVVDCMSIDDSGRASVGVDSGLWLDSETGELKGKLSCP